MPLVIAHAAIGVRIFGPPKTRDRQNLTADRGKGFDLAAPGRLQSDRVAKSPSVLLKFPFPSGRLARIEQLPGKHHVLQKLRFGIGRSRWPCERSRSMTSTGSTGDASI
jgi:hypothetical protein